MLDDYEMRIAPLKTFLDETYSLSDFQGLLSQMYIEFEFRRNHKQEPALTFFKMEADLEDLVHVEDVLKAEYDAMFQILIPTDTSMQYIEQLAQEIRIIRGLAVDAPIDLTPNNEEWDTAAAKIPARQYEPPVVDEEHALDLLVDLAKMRLEIYPQVLEARQLIQQAGDLARQPYRASFTAGSEQAGAQLQTDIAEFLSCVDDFPAAANALLQAYPRTEKLASYRALTASTD